MTHDVDSTAVEVGNELVPSEHHSTTLFATDDPVEVVEKAGRVADALKTVLDRQNLTVAIQGKAHVLVEGWTTLGSMLGVVPVVAWTRKTENGWEARVEAKTLDGRVIGAAEAECLRDERRWKTADDYAIRSMAQTRATSKALRGPLGFIITLAGYSATPFEEMPAEPERRDVEHTGRSDVTPEPLQPEQYQTLVALFAEAGSPVDAFNAALDELKAPAGGPAERVAALTADQGLLLEAKLRELVKARREAA